jgi:hypothetical protein
LRAPLLCIAPPPRQGKKKGAITPGKTFQNPLHTWRPTVPDASSTTRANSGFWHIYHRAGCRPAYVGFFGSALHETWYRCHDRSYDGTREVLSAISSRKYSLPCSENPHFWGSISIGALVGGGANGTQPPTARQGSGSQRAKALQLFLILLIGRYTSWSAESDSKTRVKSTGLPFERKYFECH